MYRWFPEFERLTDEELKSLQARFRNVFSTEIGMEVLTSILGLLKFYSQAENQVDAELQNKAKAILFLSGAWKDGNELEITRKLLGGIK